MEENIIISEILERMMVDSLYEKIRHCLRVANSIGYKCGKVLVSKHVYEILIKLYPSQIREVEGEKIFEVCGVAVSPCEMRDDDIEFVCQGKIQDINWGAIGMYIC